MALPSQIQPLLPGAPRMPDEQELVNIQNGIFSAGGSLTAHPGGGQASATPLNNAANLLGTVTTAGDSFVLPGATVPGLEVWCYNNTVTSADVFPAVGDYIAAGAINVQQAVAGGEKFVFKCVRVRTSQLGGLWMFVKSA